MDKKIFLYIYSLSQKYKILHIFSVSFAKVSSMTFFLVYVSSCFYLLFTQPGKLLAFILVPLILLAVNLIMRKSIKRPRPYTSLGIKPLLNEKGAFSCPSNHAASSFIIALVCFQINTALGFVMLFLAFLTGVNRVLTGMHYPGDVLVGWLVAITVQATAFFLLSHL